MMARILASFILALGLAAPAFAQQIFGSVYTGAGAASLYRVSPSDGSATLIGPIGFNRVGAIAFSPDRKLYGVASLGGDSVLITIDTTTGAGTLVGPFGVGSPATTDIAFRGDGTLFSLTNGGIYTIDLATGAATLVGPVSFSFSGNALTFDGSQVLLLGNTNGGTAGSLQTVSQANASVSPKVDFTYGAGFNVANGPRPAAMKFSAATRNIYASVFEGFPATVDYLARIDPVTGNVTMLGTTVLGMDGLALLDPPQVPTLSDALLLVVALVLLATGMRRVRLRDTAV